MPEESDKYNYSRFGVKGQRVGQAVFDILSKHQEMQTVGDTLDSIGPDFAKQIEECIENNQTKYKSPFYIFVLTKKEYWTDNVVRNWFIARQTPPHAFTMMEEYSNYTKTLYIVDSKKGNISVVWCLPSYGDCISIAKSPHLYDRQLVKWIEECFSKNLDRDNYSFDRILVESA